jgi:cytochrome c1
MSYGRIKRLTLAALVLTAVAGGAGLLAESMSEKRQLMRQAAALTGGDPTAGKEALPRYGCGACHTIPGVTNARGLIGPPLSGFSQRIYVAGVLYNRPENVMNWLKDPVSIDDKTAMPNTGVTDEDARNIAAFLYTLR